MIKITNGDTASLVLTATDAQNFPIDLTGATFTTTLRGLNGALITYLNSQHTANPDQVNFKGQFTLALSANDTNAIPPGKNKEIITLIVIGATQISYRGPGVLTVLSTNPAA